MKTLTKVKKVTLVLAFMLITNFAFTQFTRQQANDLVLNTILADDIGNVDVYSSINSKAVDIALIDNEPVTNAYPDSWGFFVDDSPFASWYHACRYIWVSTVNGDYVTEAVNIYPKFLNADYEIVSTANRPDPVAMEGTAFVPDPEKVLSTYNYALIVVALDNARNWYNTSLIYNVLIDNYNYKADNITVLYSWDGNSIATPYFNDLDGSDVTSDDIDGPAT